MKTHSFISLLFFRIVSCRHWQWPGFDSLGALGRRRNLLLLVLVLVEIEVDGRRMVKYEIIVAIGPRRYVYVSTLRVDMHYVVNDVRAFAVLVCLLGGGLRLLRCGHSSVLLLLLGCLLLSGCLFVVVVVGVVGLHVDVVAGVGLGGGRGRRLLAG